MSLLSERRFIDIGNLSSGMLVEFSYTKISDDSTKSYIAIVIDPNKDNYLHALLIDDLSDFELVNLVVRLGDSFTFDPDKRADPLTNLKTDEAYNKYLGIKNQRRYRTFLVNKISSLRQILIGELT